MKPFECRQCGNCCKSECLLFDGFSDEEWIRIIEFLKENYGGTLAIQCDCGCDEIQEFKDISLEKLKIARLDIDNPLYMALDYGRCPFLKKTNDSKYYCEIQEFKPKVCQRYRCDLSGEEKKQYYEKNPI